MQLQELIVLITEDILHPILIFSKLRLRPLFVVTQLLTSESKSIALSTRSQIVVIIVGCHLFTSMCPVHQDFYSLFGILCIASELPEQAKLMGSSSIVHGITNSLTILFSTSRITTYYLFVCVSHRAIVAIDICITLQGIKLLQLCSVKTIVGNSCTHTLEISSTIEGTRVVVDQRYLLLWCIAREVYRTILVLLAGGGGCAECATYQTCNNDILMFIHNLSL